MKNILLFFVLIISISASSHAQDLRKMNVFLSENFNKKASITIEKLTNDLLFFETELSSALIQNGFKVVSEKVAKSSLNLESKTDVSDSYLEKNSAISYSKDFNSIYLISFDYRYRSDTGCSGYVINSLSGQVIDLANDGEIVATFSFRQNGLEGKCVDKIAENLAKELKNNTPGEKRVKKTLTDW